MHRMVVSAAALPAACVHDDSGDVCARWCGVVGVVSWYSDVCDSVHVHEGL